MGWDTGFCVEIDGTEWSSITLPSQVSEVNNLFKVTYDGDSYWMVGASGALLYGQVDNLSYSTGFATDLITVAPSPRSETKFLSLVDEGQAFIFGKNNGKEQVLLG